MLNFIKELGKLTKAILSLGLLLIVYGYLCRILGIYFFWESRSIGWGLLEIGIIFLVLDRIKIKKTFKKNVLGEQIGLGIMIFVLLIQTILMITMPMSNAYEAAKVYLRSDSLIRTEVGTVNGFGLMLTGSLQKSTNAEGESGNATISIIVKGDKQYKDLTIYVTKSPDTTAWVVEGIE